MAVKDQYLEYVIEQLAGVAALRSRRMFGGIGFYSADRFFGLIAGDVLYLKVDDSNRADFLGRGCRPFQPFRDKPEYSMSYYDVPADVLEDAEELAAWARKSIAVAAPAPVQKRTALASARSRPTRQTRRGTSPGRRS